MIVKLNKAVLWEIFEYFTEGKTYIKDIKLWASNNKIICFDTMIYKPHDLFMEVENEKELKIFYDGNELDIIKIVVIYDEKRREEMSVEKFKQFFIEEIMNYIAKTNKFEWEYK